MPSPRNRDVRFPSQHKTQAPGRSVFPENCDLDLKTLKEMISTDVVHKINENMARFKDLLRSEEEQHNSDEFIMDLTCILAIVCNAPSSKNVNEILAALKGSIFLKSKIPCLLDRIQRSEPLNDKESQRRLIQWLIKIFTRYLMPLPSSYADLPYEQLKLALKESNIDGKGEVENELEAFKQIRDNIIIAERQKHGRRYTNMTGKKPPNDFRDLPICPTNKEMTSQERPFLRKNISKGRYQDVEHYLDIQFRLLREDFLEPLREGIYEITHNVPRVQRNQLMKCYQGVRIIGKEFTFSGVIHKAQFDASKFAMTKWTHSKRLIFGSFVCLSKDNFQTMLFATVANRNPKDLAKGRFDIRFIEEQHIFDVEKRQEQYQMAESPAYFEAYYHVLKGLQELNENSIPFSKYLVECCADVDPPVYLRRDEDQDPVCYDLSKALAVRYSQRAKKVSVLEPEAWPSVETLPLNSSQLVALKTAITTEFSVIQGPPGTGKTYVGAKIARCLLENRSQWDPEKASPMLMVCYTNHALDQFLEKVLEFNRERGAVIRVGGRSKSEKLEDCNLKVFTSKYRRHARRSIIKLEMEDNETEIEDFKDVIAKADKELLEFKDLEDSMNPRHIDQLYGSVFPPNVTSRCRNTPNIYKLWLCNNTELNDMNQRSKGSTNNKNVGEKDGSVLQEEDRGEDVEVPTTTSVFHSHLDVQNTHKSTQDKERGPEGKFVKHSPFDPFTAGFDAANEERKVQNEDPGEAREDTITLEDEATRMQNQRRIAGDEEYMSMKLQQSNKSEREKEEGVNGSDKGCTEVTYWTKSKPKQFVWKTKESGNTKEEWRVDQSVESKNRHTKEKASKKRNRKRKGAVKVDLLPDTSKLKDKMKSETMMSDEEALKVANIWFLSAKDRLRLYLYWTECFRDRHRIEIQRRERKHEQFCTEFEEVKSEEEEVVIRQATVVGMTTSCAAKYRSMLQRVGPKIVLIEEAAEVMEAHIITSLSRDTKHAILIGDHKQLRPKATVYELAQKYNLEVSLFERMVMNSLDCKRLCIQHRMRPEIAALTKRFYDHEILDHETVCKFENIAGVTQNMFFVDHCQPEILVGSLQSYSNPHEATFVMALCTYLLQQSYRPQQITILTMYVGQLLLLQEHMPRKIFEGVKICAVDNFQGEENDIILLTLVRSNLEGRIGFLGESNRICVALSRARKGFYCIGNFNMLKSQCRVWQEICDDLNTRNAIGDTLELICQRHKNVTYVGTSDDFQRLGGCRMTCGERLDCGHACDRPCHPSDVYHDRSHEKGQCGKLCFKCCSNEHQCKEVCHYPRRCPKCPEVMLKTVPQCGHEQPMACSVDPATFSCSVKCEKVLQCGHNCSNQCGQVCAVKCKVKCIKCLPCKHEKRMACHRDPTGAECNNNCEKVLECGHPCTKKCKEKCQCNNEIVIQLPCKHMKRVLCHFKHETFQCLERCRRTLNCGHDCPDICHEDCRVDRCKVNVIKELSCGHQQSVPCNLDPKGVFCYNPCQRQLDCGHKCPSVCGRLCQEVQCEELCQTKCVRGHACQQRCHFGFSCGDCMVAVNTTIPTCGHTFEMPCYTDPNSLRCNKPCERLRACEHPCLAICSKDCEARPCKLPATRTLPCGHVAALPCHKNPNKYKCTERIEVYLPCGHKQHCVCHVAENRVKNLLCNEKVEKELRCKHKLTLPCHKEPDGCKCKKKVDVQLSCGHMKSLACFTITTDLQNVCCMVKTKRTLPCEHEKTLPCYIDPQEHCCEEEVQRTLSCGHVKLTTCSKTRDELQIDECDVNVTRKLPCGHEKQMKCSEQQQGNIVCDAPCDRFLPCEHPCPKKCGDDCATVKCAVGVQKDLPCGFHKVTCLCSDNISHIVCPNKCTRSLPCGHVCPGKCSEKCNQYKCRKKVVKPLNCAGSHSLKMNCSDYPDAAKCQESCNRKLDCGHPCPGLCGDDCATVKCAVGVQKDLPCGFHKVSCLCSDNISHIVCPNKCTRSLPCGHVCPGKCSEKCNQYKCRKKVVKPLNCAGSHSLKMNCSDYPDAAKCQESCNRKLDCGHPCPGLCSEHCGSMRCMRRIEHKFPCGHKENRQCFERKTAICTAPCQRRKSSCKHLCKGVCGRDCSNYPCAVVVGKILLCGHNIEMLCSHSVDDVRCPAVCRVKLPCGHNCSGTCYDCQERGSHEWCQHPCGRLLVCSHRCNAICAEPCPPCDRKCGTRCPHRKCKKRCSQLCNTCTEPCTWRCPHYQCKNLCGEECDRPPCNAPCPEKLSCRHPCIGLCGENCPTLCGICNAKKLSSMLAVGGAVKTEAMRCLQLFDCGHIISVEEMDDWMLRELDNDVQLIRCPRCSMSITFSYRYGHIIKRTLTNIKNVKTQIQQLETEVTNAVKRLGKDIDLHRKHNVKQRKALVQTDLARIQSIPWKWNPFNLPHKNRRSVLTFTFKNHLMILEQAQRTAQVLQNVRTYREVEVGELTNAIKDAMENIKKYLEKPQLDLETLSQVHEQTRKFFLFSHVLRAQSKALTDQIPLSSISETRLKLAHERFSIFLQDNDAALDLQWLGKIVNLLRTEMKLTPLPIEEAQDFANFPGYQSRIWKLCGQGHVYYTGYIVRGGKYIPFGSEGCTWCTVNESV